MKQICPECGSHRIWKNGHRFNNSGQNQRYICRDCGCDFTASGPQNLSSEGTISHRQICVSEREMKNLVKVKPLENGLVREATADVKGQLVGYLWHMKKKGYAESTVSRRIRLLRTLFKRGGNLLDPESVKLTIANQEKWSNTTKEHAVTAFTGFLEMLGQSWDPPKYCRVRKLPFIPQEREVDQLISGCNRKTSTFLKLLKETGMRSGEAWNLQWIDIDQEKRMVSVTPEKGGNPRALPISTELVAMLSTLSKRFDQVFGGSLRHFRRGFRKQRKRIAAKLQNPRINHITFHTLRHFKATMEYHKTKSLLHVKQILGHRNINSTMLYTQLVNFREDEYHVSVAKNAEEACELVKSGFQYVTGEYSDGGKIFRKPK